jgi:hypothetical protein
MDKNSVYIVLRLELDQPAQLDDFVSAFTALSSQYQKFIRDKNPDVSEQAQVYVSEVKKGSIEAELIPWAVATANVALNYMDRVLIVDEFIRYYGGRLSAYFRKGGRDDNANNSDLKDFMGEVSSIAKDPNGSGTISSATFEDGKKNFRASITFNSDQAKNAVREIDNHKKELEDRGEADFRRVVMVFHQSNVKDSSPGKRTGESQRSPRIKALRRRSGTFAAGG